MKEILKPVPSVDGLMINHDGTLVYYKENLKNICYAKHVETKKQYKCVHVKDKSYHISRLVFEAWIEKLPKCRTLFFIDGNHLNTHYKNLGPKLCWTDQLTHMKRIPGYDELYINNNGTVLSQYGFEVNITLQKFPNKGSRNAQEIPAVCIHSERGAQYVYVNVLVACAFLKFNGRGKVIHLDGNSKNNDYNNLQILNESQYKKWLAERLKSMNPFGPPSKIPATDNEKVKKRLLNGEKLTSIAADYNCSDMAVVRFKKRNFSKSEIELINKKKGINAKRTDKEIVRAIINDLRDGKQQIKLARQYGVSPSIVCRINKDHIKWKTFN